MNGCGNPCAKCGQQQCVCCDPSILNQPRIINPIISGGNFTGGNFSAPTIAGGTASAQQIVGATIDCTTQACTQPPGTCDSTPATTGFVCTAINDAVSGLNPNFCAAVQFCLAGSPTLCTEIVTCINTTPGSINNVIAFDPAVFSTQLQVGVVRLSTLVEAQGVSCGVALEPCVLESFLLAGGPNPLWSALTTAVDSLITTSATLCAAVAACGFAPVNSPVFTGDPQAPTPLLGDNDNSIATTAFVQQAITSSLTLSCPALTTLWTAAGGAPPGATGFLGNDCFTYTTAQVFASSDAQSAIQTVVDAAILPIFFDSATTGNLAATETDAYAHLLSAGQLSADGDAIEFEASGTFSASPSVDKQIRVYFGTTVVFDSGLLTIASADWHLSGTISRTGALAQKVMTTLTTSDGTVQAIAGYATAAEDTSLAQTIKLTFNGTLANDVVGEVYRDRFVAA